MTIRTGRDIAEALQTADFKKRTAGAAAESLIVAENEDGRRRALPGDHATWAKDYQTAAQAFGRMLEPVPDLANDRGFMKGVQKARKKAEIPLS